MADELIVLSSVLANVGNREAPFPLPHDRGDKAHHGRPGIDPRGIPKGRNIVDPYGHIDRIKMTPRDFRYRIFPQVRGPVALDRLPVKAQNRSDAISIRAANVCRTPFYPAA